MKARILKCIHCGEKLERKAGGYIMVPLEKPYLNLFFHPKCLSNIEQGDRNNLFVYLTKNREIWYNRYIEYEKAKKKPRKRRRKRKAKMS